MKLPHFIFILVFITCLIFFTIHWGSNFTGVFQDLTVGLGALLAGLGGMQAFLAWQENIENKNQFRKIQATYPRERLNKEDEFKLLRNKDNGHIRIYDLKKKK